MTFWKCCQTHFNFVTPPILMYLSINIDGSLETMAETHMFCSRLVLTSDDVHHLAVLHASFHVTHVQKNTTLCVYTWLLLPGIFSRIENNSEMVLIKRPCGKRSC